MGDKDDLVDIAWAIAVDHRVFFGVEAPTVSGFVTVAAVRQSAGVAVIANG